MDAMLVLDGLTKKYQEVVAVKDLSLELHEGEFLTILGPSGSGKTTTLKMVAGLETPTSGMISVNERDITFLPPNERGLGMVFQNYALFPHMRIKDNVAFPLHMKKPRLPEAEIGRMVAEILQLVQLDGYQDRYPSQLSGGQQQRVALARALVFHPPIVLMDEPLGALDKKLRSAMQLEIKRIQQKLNITTIYVTHDQEEALTLSDRIAIMRDGEIAQLDTAKNIYEHPNSSFIADFIGESNFVPVEIAGQEGEELILRIKSEQGSLIRCPRRGAQPKPTDDLKFVIRPEKVAIGRDLGPEAKLRGQVAQVIYLGETVKYIISIDGSYHFSAKEQTMDIRSHFSVGDLIDLTWNSENSQLVC